jgi:hypothetical protein
MNDEVIEDPAVSDVETVSAEQHLNLSASECLLLHQKQYEHSLHQSWLARVLFTSEHDKSALALRRRLQSATSVRRLTIGAVPHFDVETLRCLQAICHHSQLRSLELRSAASPHAPTVEFIFGPLLDISFLRHLVVDAGLLCASPRATAAAVHWLDTRAPASLVHFGLTGLGFQSGFGIARDYAAQTAHPCADSVLAAAARLSSLRELEIVGFHSWQPNLRLVLETANTRICALRVHACGSPAAGALANALDGLLCATRLTELTFSSCVINDDDVKALCQLLESSRSLTSLELHRSIYAPAHVDQVLRAAAAATQLRSINVALRMRASSVTMSLPDRLASDNESRIAADVAFAALLNSCTQLHTLNIDDVPLDDVASDWLVEHLESGARCCLTRLTMLRVRNLLVGSDGQQSTRRTRIAAQLQNNFLLQWRFVRWRLAPLLSALAPLDWPAYVTIEVIQRINTYRQATHVQLIRAIILVKNRNRDKRTEEEKRGSLIL